MPLKPEHLATIHGYADELGVDRELARAVAEQESGHRQEKAVSRKGARGVMQIMPATSKELKARYGIDRRRQGVGYLAELNKRFGTLHPFEQRRFALAAYNAGPRTVRNAQAKARKAGFSPDEFAGVAKFLPKETQKYVPGVLARLPQDAAKFQPVVKPPLSASYLSQTRGPMIRQLLGGPAAPGGI